MSPLTPRERLKIDLMLFMYSLSDDADVMAELQVLLDEIANDMVKELAKRDGGKPIFKQVIND